MEEKNELVSGEEKKEKKKKRILKAALMEFSEKGYDKAVLEDIASKAGVAKGTLYLYYNDKRDLFNRSLLFVIDNLIELIQNIVDSNLSPIEKIESVIRDQVKYFVDNSHLFNMFQMAFQENLIMSDKELFTNLIKRKYGIVNLLSKIVEEAKGSRVVKKEFPTDDIITVFDGIVTSILKTVRARELHLELEEKEKNDDLKKKLDSLIEIVFKGILNTGD